MFTITNQTFIGYLQNDYEPTRCFESIDPKTALVERIVNEHVEKRLEESSKLEECV